MGGERTGLTQTGQDEKGDTATVNALTATTNKISPKSPAACSDSKRMDSVFTLAIVQTDLELAKYLQVGNRGGTKKKTRDLRSGRAMILPPKYSAARVGA